MIGLSLGPSSGLFGSFLPQPAGSFGAVLSKPSILYPVAVPTKGKDMDLGAAVGGTAQGAVAGGAIGGPIGAGIGGAAGLISSLFGKKGAAAPATEGVASGGGGLLDALGAGLKSIGIPGFGGSSKPMNITQTQAVSTDVNVTNVLGGRTFGGVDESGEFDTFQLLSDVFSIKDAMAANANVTSSEGAGPVSVPSAEAKSSPNLTQTALIAAGALAAIYFLTKGKSK